MLKHKWIPPIIFILSYSMFSCSNELRVYTDFDKEVSLQKLTNYDWLAVSQIESKNNPLFFNELTDKRIKTAVEAQLTAKGYVHSVNAEMIVHYHIIVVNKTGGWAVSVLDDEKMIDEQLINNAVTEIFKKFPVSAAKEVTLP